MLLPRAASRSYLLVQNLSAGSLYVEIGDARATAALSLGKIASFTVTNAGFGYARAPTVRLLGGGNQGNASFQAVGQPGYPEPDHPGAAHAVLGAGGVISSIVVDDPGWGYAVAPMVFLVGDPIDPIGCADPYYNSANSGVKLSPSGGSMEFNGTICPTTAVAIWGATTEQAFTCRWMP